MTRLSGAAAWIDDALCAALKAQGIDPVQARVVGVNVEHRADGLPRLVVTCAMTAEAVTALTGRAS